jgi:three-Cys-motif partner protein
MFVIIIIVTMTANKPHNGMQQFGKGWTLVKLKAVEDYLDSFTTAMKHWNFKLCYIDAFAGCGSIELNNGDTIEGSAIRALKYPFDKYIFFDTKQQLLNDLEQKINPIAQGKDIEYHCGDCNKYLIDIHNKHWKADNWRGVIFLDPFAMNLGWDCLNSISATKVFDVWYLFPFSATNRNLKTDGKIPPANRKILNYVLGTNDWEDKIYSVSPQSNFLNEIIYEKANTEKIREYILTRLKQTFPTCSDNAKILRTEVTNSPLFLLCFAGSNPSIKARDLSLRLANHIFSQS